MGIEVYTIEIQKQLAEDLPAKFVGYNGINFKYGDGYHGWPKAAPFDAVIITCAAKLEVPKPIRDQLKEGGVIVVPIEHEDTRQVLYQSKKIGDNFDTKTIIPVRFVPFTRDFD